jgi:hypothetical protein
MNTLEHEVIRREDADLHRKDVEKGEVNSADEG